MKPKEWTDDLIEDVCLLIETGSTPQEVAHRIGKSVRAIEIALRRAGERKAHRVIYTEVANQRRQAGWAH